MTQGRATVTARGAQRLRAGHPWIFRADVAGVPQAGPGGDAAVVDAHGKLVGSALVAAPPAPLALRVYARGPSFVPFDDALLAARLDAALVRRRVIWPAGLPEGVRLVHAEADGLPGLFVDRWGDAAVVQSACAAMDAREAAVARWLALRLGVRLVVARDDGSTRELEGLPRRKAILAGGGATLVEVAEGGARLAHDLLGDAKTGGFLDQRDNHLRAGELAFGQALDLFSHHGGFALAMAAPGRAARVTAVELDARAAERIADNARRSGRTVDVQCADAFVFLREAERTGRRWDTIVVDPPALAKRAGGSAAALGQYRELNTRAMRCLAPGGLLVSCSCSGKVTPAIFGDLLAECAAAAGRAAVVLERRGAGADHPVLLGVPETEYLKCWILQVP